MGRGGRRPRGGGGKTQEVPSEDRGKTKNGVRKNHLKKETAASTPKQGQYEKVRGTEIQTRRDGSVVRVVRESGKTFQPNDVKGVMEHLDKLARTTGDMGVPRRESNGRPQSRGGKAQSKGGAPAGMGSVRGGDYEKIKGTQIRTLEDGRVVRFVPQSNKVFQPNDVMGVQAHLAKLRSSSGPPPEELAPQGGRARSGRRREMESNARPAHQYEKIKGTQIRVIDGEVFRVVNESGKIFQPNDLQTVYHHLDSLAKGGGKGQVSKGKSRGMMALPAPGESRRKRGGKIAAIDTPMEKRGEGRRSKRGKVKPGKDSMPPVKKSFLKNEVRRRRKKEKELPPEKLEEIKQKRKERFQNMHAKRIVRDGRELASAEYHLGEVKRRTNGAVWVKPMNVDSIPSDVMQKLIDMNEKIREKATAADKKGKGKGGRRRKEQASETNDLKEDLVFVSREDVKEDDLVLKPGVQIKFKLYTDKKGVGGCEVVAA